MQLKARERLALLVDPAISTVGDLIRQRKHLPVALGAAKDALDRAGLAFEDQRPMSAPTIIVEVHGIARPHYRSLP